MYVPARKFRLLERFGMLLSAVSCCAHLLVSAGRQELGPAVSVQLPAETSGKPAGLDSSNGSACRSATVADLRTEG